MTTSNFYHTLQNCSKSLADRVRFPDKYSPLVSNVFVQNNLLIFLFLVEEEPCPDGASDDDENEVNLESDSDLEDDVTNSKVTSRNEEEMMDEGEEGGKES